MATSKWVLFCFFILGDIVCPKFEQHHSNYSRDFLDFVIYLCTETICDVISVFFLIEYICNEKRCSKKKKTTKQNAILLLFKRPYK